MAHKNPQQVHRLICRLLDGASECFIHIDKNSEFSQFEILEEFGRLVHFIDRFDSTWGRYGLTLPYLAGLKAVKNSSENFDRVILLSGQDYPIKSNAEINSFFQNSEYSVFIKYFQIPNHVKWPGSDRGGLYRVDKYYLGNRWYQLVCSKSLNFLSTYLPVLKRKMPNGMKPFAGETWCIIDMYALNYILDFVKGHPEYLAFHKYTYVADELFVPMIVGNSKDEKLLKSVANCEKRFTIWDQPQSGHPKILGKDDFASIIDSDDLFARKFEPDVDKDILDLIDDVILSHRLSVPKVV